MRRRRISLAGLALVFEVASLASAPAPACAERVAVAPDALRDAIESAWRLRAPSGATFEIRTLPTLHHDDGDSIAIDVALPDPLDAPGRRVLTLSCRAGERVVSRGLASGMIRVRSPVWIATSDLASGEALSTEAIEPHDQWLERADARIFHLEEGRRYRLTRDVPSGAVLSSRDVTRLPDVEVGSIVTLVSRAGAAAVEVTGRVRRSGDVGDTILVDNPLSNTLVHARLVDARTAELLAPVSKRRTGAEPQPRQTELMP